MDDKRKMGRPLKFSSVEDLQQKVDEYFGACDPHVAKRKVMVQKADGSSYVGEEEYITDQKPYTITGLALALDTTRDTLLDYESGKYDSSEGDAGSLDFSDTITRAKLRCQQFAEQHLFTGKNPSGAQFSLKNNYGWVDKTVQEHEGGFFGEGGRLEVEIVNSEPKPDEGAQADTQRDSEPSANTPS